MLSPSVESYLKMMLSSVGDNSSHRFDCPSCGGRQTLSVDKYDGQVKYICFKASCGLRGVNDYTLTTEGLRNRVNKLSSVAESYVKDDHIILGIGDERCVDMLQKYHCLDAYKKGLFKCGFDPLQDRLVIFITDSCGKIVGAVGRSLPKKKDAVSYPKPKTFNYYIEQPFVCGKGDIIVLVEDVFSAIAVTRLEGYVGLALLGTNLKKNYIETICGYDKVIVALDKDAKTKALKIKNTLDYYHRDVTVQFLEQDIKDMNDLKELIC